MVNLRAKIWPIMCEVPDLKEMLLQEHNQERLRRKRLIEERKKNELHQKSGPNKVKTQLKLVPQKSDEDLGEDDEANKTDDDSLSEVISQPNDTKRASLRKRAAINDQDSVGLSASAAGEPPEELKESEKA